jgi:hypothetical protein
LHFAKTPFKQIGDSAAINERIWDYITGHAHRRTGGKYVPTVEDMAAALEKFSSILD